MTFKQKYLLKLLLCISPIKILLIDTKYKIECGKTIIFFHKILRPRKKIFNMGDVFFF